MSPSEKCCFAEPGSADDDDWFNHRALYNVHGDACRRYGASSRSLVAKFKGRHKKCSLCRSYFWRFDLPRELPRGAESKEMCFICAEAGRLGFGRLGQNPEFATSEFETEQNGCHCQSDRFWKQFNEYCTDEPRAYYDEFEQSDGVPAVVTIDPVGSDPASEVEYQLEPTGFEDPQMDFAEYVRERAAFENSTDISNRLAKDWEEHFNFDS